MDIALLSTLDYLHFEKGINNFITILLSKCLYVYIRVRWVRQNVDGTKNSDGGGDNNSNDDRRRCLVKKRRRRDALKKMKEGT